MQYPVVLVDDNDVLMFENEAMLSGYIEAVDVLAGVYEALDSEGSPLELTVDSSGSVKAVDRVADAQPQRLAHILRRYLTASDLSSSFVGPLESATLAELVDAAFPLAGEGPR